MKRFFMFSVLAAGLFAAGAAQAATVLITGSNRGLGLEFVKQYAEQGWNVIATSRSPSDDEDLKALAAKHKTVTIEKLDVTDTVEIAALASKYKGQPIDLLLNNAGVLGGGPEQSLGHFSQDRFHQVLNVNVFGPLAVSEAFRENVIASEGKKIISMTSGLGSIAGAGGMPNAPYYYRISKAGLNMAMRALGADLRAQGVAVGVVAPGTVETDMLEEVNEMFFAKMNLPSIGPEESISKLIDVIAALTPATAAKGINNYDGSVMPW
jgi:NAD(P)-dependent dehydrogenase (short-subunit alcohol dehydrogenase family)